MWLQHFSFYVCFFTFWTWWFQGKRRHRRRWSSIRLKKRKLNGEGDLEEGDGNQGEREEGNSEESCKSEENPIEDACSHCGLPNHPELVRMDRLCGSRCIIMSDDCSATSKHLHFKKPHPGKVLF